MRSTFMFVALAAVIGFTGCCGTGGSCKLGSSLGAGKALRSAGVRDASGASFHDFSHGGNVSDCGCGGSVGSVGSVGAASACSTCGPDSMVTTSAPHACDGGCGSEPVPSSASSSCGCSSCGDSATQYAPAQSSGCSSCDAAAATHTPRGFLSKRPAKQDLASNKGMGLFLKGKGKACEGKGKSCSLFDKSKSRSLSQPSGSSYVSDRGMSIGSDCGCDACEGGEVIMPTVAQMPSNFSDAGGRRISTGIISDIRGARAGRRPIARRAGGCGRQGCGHDGIPCEACSRAIQLSGNGHPYGGAVPHTNPAAGQQPQSGLAPQYAYPYYTTRGPRDFLRDNPPSIGY